MDQQEKKPLPNRLKTIIIILSVLLALSAGALAARMIYLHFFAHPQFTDAVQDNVISDETDRIPGEKDEENGAGEAGNDRGVEGTDDAGEQAAAEPSATGQTADGGFAPVLELYRGNPNINQRFEVKNMLPGDVETRYFCLKIYQERDAELLFKTEITGQTKEAAEALHIRVTRPETGEVVCDAPFSEINGKEFSELLKKTSSGETAVYYRIDVSLDTSVGNEYQAAMLKADFQWYVSDADALSPKTGSRPIDVLLAVLAVTSLFLIVLLYRRGKEEQDGKA